MTQKRNALTITFNAQGGQINKLVRPDDAGNSWSMYRCCLVNNFNEYKANVNLFPDNTPLNVDKEILEDKDYFDDTVDQSLEEDEEIMSYTNPSHRTTDPTYDMESRMSIESMLESGVDVIKANGNFFYGNANVLPDVQKVEFMENADYPIIDVLTQGKTNFFSLMKSVLSLSISYRSFCSEIYQNGSRKETLDEEVFDLQKLVNDAEEDQENSSDNKYIRQPISCHMSSNDIFQKPKIKLQASEGSISIFIFMSMRSKLMIPRTQKCRCLEAI